MKPLNEQYRDMRKRIGVQREVAAKLGVTTRAMIRREAGQSRITQEMMEAMVHLADCKPKIKAK